MKEWELTDDELKQLNKECIERADRDALLTWQPSQKDRDRFARRKLLEYLDEPCPHYSQSIKGMRRLNCDVCWQSLKKEFNL